MSQHLSAANPCAQTHNHDEDLPIQRTGPRQPASATITVIAITVTVITVMASTVIVKSGNLPPANATIEASIPMANPQAHQAITKRTIQTTLPSTRKNILLLQPPH